MAEEYISKNKAVNAVKSLIGRMPAKDNYAKGYDAALGRVLIAVRGVPIATDVQPIDRWINAQTNPPIATDGETSDYVLVLRADGRQCVCYYVYDDDEGNCWFSEDEKSMYDIDEVTHWQPLPEPPKD